MKGRKILFHECLSELQELLSQKYMTFKERLHAKHLLHIMWERYMEKCEQD